MVWFVAGCTVTAYLDLSATDSAAVPLGTERATIPDGLEEVSGLWSEVLEEVGSVVKVGWVQNVPADVWVQYAFDEGVWLSSPARTLAAGSHEELLLGIPYGEAVTWQLSIDGKLTTPRMEVTDDPPGKMPVPELGTSDPSRFEPSMQFVYTAVNEAGANFGGRWWVMFVDRQGRVVWARRTDVERVALHPRPSWDGRTLLMEQNSYWGALDGGVSSQIQRLTIDGTVLQTWDTPGLHHPYMEKPNGALVYAHMYGPYADDTLDVIAPDGTRTELFSCDAFLSSIDQPGYCGSNTVSYDEASNRFLFSLYSTDAVVEVDADTGQATRWFGQLNGAYVFEPEESTFWWQHGGYWTAEGTLLLSTRVSEAGHETVVREYVADDTTGTLAEVWNFGVGLGVYGAEMGEAHRLAGGNTLHNYGTNARLREATPEGEVVWELFWPNDQDIGRSTPISDLYAFAPVRL